MRPQHNDEPLTRAEERAKAFLAIEPILFDAMRQARLLDFAADFIFGEDRRPSTVVHAVESDALRFGIRSVLTEIERALREAGSAAID